MPEASELVWLSVIVYGSSATVAVPLSELVNVRVPYLRSGGASALGDALRLLSSSVKREVVKASPSSHGDYGPLVLIVSDGSPTDEWKSAAVELRASVGRMPIIACGLGSDADVDVLSKFADKTVQVLNTPDAIAELFNWLAATTEAALRSSAGDPCQFPPMFAGDRLREIPAHARCVDRPKAPDESRPVVPAVTCLVIMPFRKEFDVVFEAVREAARTVDCALNFDCYWLKDVMAAGRITDDIVDGLIKSALCIADVSENNPNVMWEAGYSMALGKPTILIGQDVAQLPFDRSGAWSKVARCSFWTHQSSLCLSS